MAHKHFTLMLKGAHCWSSVVKEWNQNNPKQCQLTGGNAAAVKNYVENTPQQVFQMIRKHMSNWGWDKNAFSEDSLASKNMWRKIIGKELEEKVAEATMMCMIRDKTIHGKRLMHPWWTNAVHMSMKSTMSNSCWRSKIG